MKLPRILLFPLFLVIGAGTALAQYDAEHFSVFSFRYQNPGARARGMGGAFIGLADDATAALVNPAGIAYLEGTEVSVEYSNEKNEFLTGRRTNDFGTVPDYLPTAKTESDAVTFASFLKSFKNGRFVLGAYYARLIDQQKFSADNPLDFVYIPTAVPPTPPDSAFYPTGAATHALLETYGISAALRFSSQLSAGVTVASAQFKYDGISMRYELPDPSNPSGIGPLYNSEYSHSDDSALLWTFGVLWAPTPRLSLGFSWQNEMDFAMENSAAIYFEDSESPSATGSFDSSLTLPSRIALGVGFKVTDNLTLAADLIRVQYGDLLKGMPHGFFDQWTYGSSGEEAVILWDPDLPRNIFEADDITEYHGGVEYTFATPKAGWSLRAGYWRNRGHNFYMTGAEEGADWELTKARLWAYPRSRDVIHHWTAGVGVSIKAFMLDFAVDTIQDGPTSWVGSLVIRL